MKSSHFQTPAKILQPSWPPIISPSQANELSSYWKHSLQSTFKTCYGTGTQVEIKVTGMLNFKKTLSTTDTFSKERNSKLQEITGFFTCIGHMGIFRAEGYFNSPSSFLPVKYSLSSIICQRALIISYISHILSAYFNLQSYKKGAFTMNTYCPELLSMLSYLSYKTVKVGGFFYPFHR